MKKLLNVGLLTVLTILISNFLPVTTNGVEASSKETDEYIIHFNPENGEEAKQIIVQTGEKITEEQIPFQSIQKDDLDFLGWFYGPGNKYNVHFPFDPEKDQNPKKANEKELTFIAKWGKHHPANEIEKPGYRLIFNDEFDSSNNELNPDLWVDQYLSSWTRTPALAQPVYELVDGTMSLRINEDTQPWAPEYDGATVVSGFTTGNRNALHNWNLTNEVRNPVETELTHINQYGYYEIRAKTQAGSSRHSAWWLLGFEDEPGQSAEIDIFEVLGNDSTRVPLAFHNWNDPNAFGSGGVTHVNNSKDFHNEWHVYGMDWQKGTGTGKYPDKLVFYIDGEKIGEKDTNITYPMIQLFSLYEKREGGWTGAWEWMPYPNTFDIDYARVYKKLPEGQEKVATDELKITEIENSTVEVIAGQAALKTYTSKVVGNEGETYTEPNLPNTKSYVNVKWNDRIVTQEFVKWDPITDADLEKLNNGENVTKTGVLPNLTGTPGLEQPTLNIEAIQGPPYTSENLGTQNSQSELAKLFDGDIESNNSGVFKFDSNPFTSDKEVNIQYDFRKKVKLNSIAFTTNYGMDQGIKKFKLALWDQANNEWQNIDHEYELNWATSQEETETLHVEVGPLQTSKIKIIITDAGLTWGNKIAMRQIAMGLDEEEPDLNISELEFLINDAKSIKNEGKYAETTYVALQKAIAIAQQELEEAETKEEVEAAIVALQSAIDGLLPLEQLNTSYLLSILEDRQGDLSEKDYRSLKLHLTAVGKFEEIESPKKVMKHLEGFKQLLDHQLKNNSISTELYEILKTDANSLIKKWKGK